MKVIFLNAWHGQRHDAFMTFIRTHADTTDVFCLSEMYEAELRQECRELLSDYQEFTAEKYVTADSSFLLATYAKRGLGADTATLLQETPNVGLALYTRLFVGGKTIGVCSVHGMPRPGSKLDTPDRLRQSQELLDYCVAISGPQLIGGDFNLMPDTDSVRLFERHDWRNLIKDYGITTTRNQFAWRHPEKQYFADYAFVTSDIHVQKFEVPQNEISDHLPLILEVSL